MKKLKVLVLLGVVALSLVEHVKKKSLQTNRRRRKK